MQPNCGFLFKVPQHSIYYQMRFWLTGNGIPVLALNSVSGCSLDVDEMWPRHALIPFIKVLSCFYYKCFVFITNRNSDLAYNRNNHLLTQR